MTTRRFPITNLNYSTLIILAMTCFFGGGRTTLGQVNIDSGLVAYYPFNGNALDNSGNTNHGTVNGATLTTDRFGVPNSAYHFTGGSSKITVPHDSTLNTGNQQSLSAWVYMESKDWPLMMIISKGFDNDTGCYRLWMYRQPDSNFTPWYTMRETFYYTDATAAGKRNFGMYEWFHMCGTFDGSQVKIYVNGRLDSTYVTGLSIIPNNKPLNIGHMGFNYLHQGKIDEPRVYNRALTDCEVLALYKFGEPSNTVITDNNICENDSTSIEITNSDSLKTFQLQDTLTGSLLGIPVNGTTNTIILPTGQLFSTTAFRIIETDTATGCQRVLDSILTVTVTPYPATPSVSVAGTDSLKCSVTGTAYQWFHEDSLLAANSQTIVASQSGTYKVVVFDNNCSSDTSAGFLYIGIDTRSNISKLAPHIYPNPTDGTVHIELHKSYRDLSITIKNLLGQKLISSSFTSKQHIDLEMNHLKTGLYFIQIRAGESTVAFKIIKE